MVTVSLEAIIILGHAVCFDVSPRLCLGDDGGPRLVFNVFFCERCLQFPPRGRLDIYMAWKCYVHHS